MTSEPKIIGIVKELKGISLERIATQSHLTLHGKTISSYFPAIAESLLIAVEALNLSVNETCYCEWTDCSHDEAKEALSKISSL